MSTIRAIRVEDIDAPDTPPGAFELFVHEGREIAGMIYLCPCGCKRTGVLRFRRASPPSWEWDGNKDAPTLSPSVHHVGHWHGWLRAGEWVSC